MRSSETTDKIDAAMARVQAALTPVQRNKGVKVDGERAKWESKYVTLDALHAACRDALREEGIVIYQGGEWGQGAGERLVTRLAYQGQWIEASFPIKTSRDGAQGFGAGISFAKRWGLCGMVGLIAADDPEEARGYRDEARPAKPQRVAAGVGAALDAIRSATSGAELTARAAKARAANPTGAGAAEVERCIGDWFVTEAAGVPNLDALTALRDLAREVRPRGAEVHAAIRQAESKLLPLRGGT